MLYLVTKNAIEFEPNFDDQFGFKDNLAESVAKNLAKSLKYKEVRAFIKSESIKTFDEDFNFLISKLKNYNIEINDSGIKNHIPFKKFIYDINENGDIINSFVDDIEKHYPKMQIAVPEMPELKVEDWDYENYIPLVCYVPYNFDMNESSMIKAFDHFGNETFIDARIYPDKHIIVISENERTMLVKNDQNHLRKQINDCSIDIEPYYTTKYFSYYISKNYHDQLNECLLSDYLNENSLRIDEGDDPIGPIDDGGVNTPSACDRTRKDGQYDILNKVKFPNKTSFKKANDGDTFFDYRMEFKVIILYGTQVGGAKYMYKFFYGKDGDFKDCFFGCSFNWVSVNLRIIRWHESDYGKYMHYHFYEEDGGATITISSNFSNTFKLPDGGTTSLTTSVSYSVKQDDDDLGMDVLEYCDNTDGEGTTYTTGIFEFKVKQ